MQSVDAVFSEASKSIGFPADQLKYITVLLLAYPAAFIFKRLPNNAPLKHLFSIVLSISFCTFCLGPYAWLHSFLSSLVVYILCTIIPSRYVAQVVFVWALGYMSVSHIYRMSVDYMGWTLDFTTMQMVLTIKLTSFGFNYADGQKNPESLSEDQRKKSIKKLPSLLEYFGWVYFFTGFMAGPALEITEYQRFIDMSMFPNKTIPSTFVPAMKKLANSLFFLPIVAFLSPKFPMEYLITSAYLTAPIYERLVRMYVHPMLSRMKYYFGWFMAEGACIACGIGYNGVNAKGEIQWDRCTNVVVLNVECAENLRSVTTYWNMKTAEWLKNYIYLRLPSGLFNTVATYSVSAFWHGFYPGYYLFFLEAAILTEVARDLRRVVRPMFMVNERTPKSTKIVYDLASYIVTAWFLNYAGAAFLLLSFDYALIIYNNVYWMGHIIPLVALIMFRTVFAGKSQRPGRGPNTKPVKKAE